MLISIIRTILLYAFVILAVRLMGKRQMSDMQPSELVITMIVSDIASIPMQNTSQPLLSGVIPVAILVALEITASITATAITQILFVFFIGCHPFHFMDS